MISSRSSKQKALDNNIANWEWSRCVTGLMIYSSMNKITQDSLPDVITIHIQGGVAMNNPLS